MKSGRPRCVTCTYRCPRKRERVRNRTHRDRDRDRDPSTTMLCATNNITYPSWCHIIKDACVTGFVLETRHAGPCNAYDTAPLYIGELTVVKKYLIYVMCVTHASQPNCDELANRHEMLGFVNGQRTWSIARNSTSIFRTVPVTIR